MHLLEDSPLAVPQPSFRALKTALENARGTFGDMTDVYIRRLTEVLTTKRASLDDPATRNTISEVRVLFFMKVLDLEALMEESFSDTDAHPLRIAEISDAAAHPGEKVAREAA